MKAEERISKTVREGVATLSGMWDIQLMYLGGSCKASIHPGVVVTSFSVSLEEHEEAVIGIKTSRYVTSGKHGDWEYGHFLIRASRMDGKTTVDLDTFVPQANRIGQIIPDAGLSVRIDDELFLSPLLVWDYHREEKLAKLRSQYRLVSVGDANLLCRFISGKATAEEVKAAAEQFVLETVNVPKIQVQLLEAQERGNALESELGEAEHSRTNLLAQLMEAEFVASGFQKFRQTHRDLLKNLESVLDGTDSVPGFWQHRSTCKLERIGKLVKQAKADLPEPA